MTTGNCASRRTRIRWVNHASAVIDHGDVHLLMDPWLEGTAFDNGWALVSDTKFSYEDFGSVTHIWFSHEHPDHFSPPVLRKIPAEHRRKITVLYQSTRDKKVVNYCRDLGFGRVQELEHGEWCEVGCDVSVLCLPVGEGDSLLAVNAGGRKLLNINDCVVDSDRKLETIRGHIGNVEVLLTQFSYANWVGNPDQREMRKRAAEEKLGEIARQVRVFAPRFVIPFASYIYFCHDENFYHNDEINRVEKAAHFIQANTKADPIVLYPGDEWEVGAPHDSGSALHRYAHDLQARLQNGPTQFSAPVELAELQAAYEKYIRRVVLKNPLFKLLPLRNPVVEIWGHGVFELTRNGMRRAEQCDSADIALSGQAFLYCVQYTWGLGTLAVNGRYRRPAGGNFRNFHQFFRIGALNNHGQQFNLLWMFGYVKRRLVALLFPRRARAV